MSSLNNGNLDSEIDKLAATPRLLLMFDFDGTLSPIVSEPQNAEIDEEIESIIKNLEMQNTEVWIVSGRDLNDLKKRVPFRNLIGSHGLECPFMPEQKSDKKIRDAEKNLKKVLKDHRGIQIESKMYSVSVHYRNYSGNVDEIQNIVKNEGKSLQITEGKKVVEIRLPGRDKGDVCRRLIERSLCGASLYAGDDITDEDAFRALKGMSVTVKVGNGKTSADYQTASITELKDFLKSLLEKREINFAKI